MTEAKAPSTTKAKIKDVELLRPEVINITLPVVGDIFIQKLGFIAKTELFGFLAGAIDDLFQQGSGVLEVIKSFDLSEEAITALQSGETSGTSGDQLNKIAQVIVKVALNAPRLLEDLFLITLQVRPESKATYLAVINSPEFTDELAFKVLNGFMDLNGGSLKDFFEEWKTLIAKAKNLA